MEIRLVTAPTTTPISLQEAKDHLYLTADTYNEELVRKVDEAVDYCQRRIRGHRQLCAATYDVVLDEFPDGDALPQAMTANSRFGERITLPLPPLSSVKWIKYYNSSGTLTTFGSTTGSTGSSTSWTMVKPKESPGYIQPAFSAVWPTARDVPDAVTVRIVAGTTDATTIPATIKSAIKLKLEQLWDPARVDADQTDKAVDNLLSGNDYGFYG